MVGEPFVIQYGKPKNNGTLTCYYQLPDRLSFGRFNFFINILRTGIQLKIQRYKHDSDISWTLGATLTIELLNCRPNQVTRVFFSSLLEQSDAIKNLISLCNQHHIPIEINDKIFNILSPKGNCYVIAEFRKYTGKLSDESHIVLVNPSDMGNLGTILRTATGFGIQNIAIIRPSVDCFDPKTIRASMGALFHTEIEYFDSIQEYCSKFPKHLRYAFMLSKSAKPLTDIKFQEPCSLIFGNEARGLPAEYAEFCEPVIIKHLSNIDSLNLSMAVGIAIFEYTRNKIKP